MELLNILSWISYTVPYDSIPGRLAPLVTILLAMINTVMRAVGESPDKSHFTPLMGFCFVNQIQVENQNKDVPYARQYNPRFIYFLPHFSLRFIL